MSYNTLADSGLQGYLGKSDEEVQAALNEAENYLDALYSARYRGVLVSADIAVQPNLWPRQTPEGEAVTDTNGRELSGIPLAIKEAEKIAAKKLLDGDELIPTAVPTATSASTQNRELIEETVKADGIVSTEKWSPSSSTTTSTTVVDSFNDFGLPLIPAIQSLMQPLLVAKNSSVISRYTS